MNQHNNQTFSTFKWNFQINPLPYHLTRKGKEPNKRRQSVGTWNMKPRSCIYKKDIIREIRTWLEIKTTSETRDIQIWLKILITTQTRKSMARG